MNNPGFFSQPLNTAAIKRAEEEHRLMRELQLENTAHRYPIREQARRRTVVARMGLYDLMQACLNEADATARMRGETMFQTTIRANSLAKRLQQVQLMTQETVYETILGQILEEDVGLADEQIDNITHAQFKATSPRQQAELSDAFHSACNQRTYLINIREQMRSQAQTLTVEPITPSMSFR